MNKVDFKEMIMEAYSEGPCPAENKKILNEIVDAEDAFLNGLNDEQKKLYGQIDSLKAELDVLTENQIVDFVLSVFKSIFS